MGDEHRLRRAQIKHRVRSLLMRVLHLLNHLLPRPRCCLRSYAVLRPDSVNGLLAGPVMNTPLGVITAVMTVISFCASLWVVYLTGYSASELALPSFKAPRPRQSIRLSRCSSRRKHMRADSSTCPSLPWYSPPLPSSYSTRRLPPSFLLVIIFLIFMLNGAFYKRKIDKKLNRWTRLHARLGDIRVVRCLRG